MPPTRLDEDAKAGAMFDKMRAAGLKVRPGSFAENITTRGLVLYELPIGTRLRLGPTLAGVDRAVLLQTLLPRPPVDGVDAGGTSGAIVAGAMLDTAYQLK